MESSLKTVKRISGILIMFSIFVGCAVVEGNNPDVVSSIYIVDNILINDPCVIGVDSVLYVVANRSDIKSKQDLPEINSPYTWEWGCGFYQVWASALIDQYDFFRDREFHPKKLWSSLFEVYTSYGGYTESFLSNLKLIWVEDGVSLYEFVKKPRSFIVVLQQDSFSDCSNCEGDLGCDVAPILRTRDYKQYVCPVQKRYRVNL